MRTGILPISTALVFCFIPYAMSQPADQEGPRPDRWHGLVLDQSTPEDAKRVLGDPASDKPDRLIIYSISKWFQPGLNKKSLRKLAFRGIEDFDKVDLYFLKDKLVVIQLDPHAKIAPTALPKAYGVEFNPIVSGIDEAMSPQLFERNQGKVYPKTYPTSYSLVGAAPKSIINALIDNAVGSAMKSVFGVRDTAGGGFPGTVHNIQLLSRTLENRQGADLLK